MGTRLFSVTTNNGNLVELNPATGATLATIPITIPGQTVAKGNGLAVDPTTGTLYAVGEGSFASGRSLFTIAPNTGSGTFIGATGSTDLSGLAFDSFGTLYGINGDGSGNNELFVINKTTGAATLIRVLANHRAGEALAFNPNDGKLYRASGFGIKLAFQTIGVIVPAPFLASIPAAQAAALLPGLSSADADFFINGLSASGLSQIAGGLATQLQGLSGAPLLDFAKDLSGARAGLVLDNFTSSQATEIRNCDAGARDCLGKKRASGADLRWVLDTLFFPLSPTAGVLGFDGANITDTEFIHGSHITGDKFAAIIKLAFEESNGSTDTYTVTFNPATKKFTFTNNAGNANAITLNPIAVSAVATAMGFTTPSIVIPVGSSATGDTAAQLFRSLTPIGEAVATSLARELNRLSGGEPLFATAPETSAIRVGSSFNVAKEILTNINPEAPTASGAIADAWGGGMTPANYGAANNGGYQAGQLRSTASGGSGAALIDVSSRTTALGSNGFLSYAVQVEEDIANAAALAVRDKATNSFVQGTLNALVESQLALSDIRARDALLQAQADARAGLVLRSSAGARVRVQQYVYRPPTNSDEVRMTSVALRSDTGLSYTDLRVGFSSGGLAGMNALGIRNLPWNDIFTVGIGKNTGSTDGGCSAGNCNLLAGNPSGQPTLGSLTFETGNNAGDFLREKIAFSTTRANSDLYGFDGTLIKANFQRQRALTWELTTRKAGEAAKVFQIDGGGGVFARNLHAGSSRDSSVAIPAGEFRVIPRQFLEDGLTGPVPSAPADRPDYFHYVMNDGGTIRHIPLILTVVGDATTSSNSGIQSSTCGSAGNLSCSTLRFDNVWAAFRVNQPAGPQALPTINIGANVLQITADITSGAEALISLPIETFHIPWARMIWRGESGF